MWSEFPDVQAGFRKGRGTRNQIASICWIMEKAREFQKNIYFYFIDYATMPKPLTVWITTNCGKFWKRWEYQTTWPASWENCVQVRKQQSELDMEQQTGSKSRKEYVKAVYCHSAYLTYAEYLRNTGLEEAQARIKIAGRNINDLRYREDICLMAESEEELKSLWWKWKRRVKKLA